MEHIMKYFEGADVPECWVKQALCKSRIPDANGVMPGGTGYIDTYDYDWAAGLVARDLAKRQMVASAGVTLFTSEGTTIQTDPKWWNDLADKFFADSEVIGPATGYGTGMRWVDAGTHSAPFIPESVRLRYPRRTWRWPWNRGL